MSVEDTICHVWGNEVPPNGDRLVVMGDGKVLEPGEPGEPGEPEELLESGGAFAELWEKAGE